MLVHRFCSVFGFFQYFQSLLLKPLFLFRFRRDDDAMGLGVVVLIEIGEGGEAIGSGLFGFATPVHLGIDGECRAPGVDHLTLKGDDVAGEDGKLEVDAVKHQQDGVFGVNVLCHSKIRAFQEPLGASSREEGLMVVEVGEFD